MKITEVELKILCMLAVSSLRTSDIAEKLDRNNAYVGVYVSKLKEKELIERDNSAYGICFKISQSGIAHLTKRAPDKCPRCNGRGKVRSTNNSDVMCPLCKGAGTYG